MRLFRTITLLCSIPQMSIAADLGLIRISEIQQKFCTELAKEYQTVEKASTSVAARPDGWLFFAAELRLLSVGKFWGDEAMAIARTRKPDQADPAAAIIDFSNQLKRHGIGLLL